MLWDWIYGFSDNCAAKRIDTELCSSNLVFGAPEEGDEEALKEFREVMQGEIQAGQLIEISTTEVLSATKDPPAWRVHQLTDWYSEKLATSTRSWKTMATFEFQKRMLSQCHFLGKVVKLMKRSLGKRDLESTAINTVQRHTKFSANLK